LENSQIGLDQFYYAEVLTDTVDGCTYDTPVAITGIITASVKANGSIETQYADDGPAANAASVGKQEIDLEFTNLAPAVRAALLGHTVTSGVIEEKASDTPKTVAIGFRSMKSNGAYRYVWYAKGQFAVPDDSYKTKEAKINFGTTKMTFSGLRRDYDSKYKIWADDDDDAVAAGTITAWFDAVPITITSPDALTLATSPTDGASGVAINVSPTFTYNNAIPEAFATGDYADDYFYLIDPSDGSKIAAALTINATCKIVTLNPDEDLTNDTEYILVASGLVTDIYGQKLAAGTRIANFSTVAL